MSIGAQSDGRLPADDRCWSNVSRYVDCGNGTVRDQVTGLLWLQQSDCLPNTNYADANRRAANLRDGRCKLTDTSKEGDWRLPTHEEWAATLARAGELNCSYPALTSNDGLGCYGAGPNGGQGGYFRNVVADAYFSSSTYDQYPPWAWFAGLGNPGDFNSHAGKEGPLRVWPVRADLRR